MNRPAALNICGKIYRVLWLKDRKEVGNGESLFGRTDPDIREIRVWDGDEESALMDTLIHETCHAIHAELPSLLAAIRPALEETYVTEFASVLADTLIRNGIIDPYARTFQHFPVQEGKAMGLHDT